MTDIEEPVSSIEGRDGIITAFISGAQTAATGKWRMVIPFNLDLLYVRLSATTAPAGADLIVDVNKSLAASPGTPVTIFTTQTARPRIVDGSTDITAANTKLPDITAYAKGDILSFDVDTIGSGTAGSGLTVSFHYEKL